MATRSRKRNSAPRRRTKQGVNLINVAQSYVVASAATKAMFGTNLLPFLTEGWLTEKTTATDNSWELSMAELVNIAMGGTGSRSTIWQAKGITGAIQHNLKNNTGAIATMVLAPAAFNVAKKLTARPRRDANRLLKMTGLNTVVKV